MALSKFTIVGRYSNGDVFVEHLTGHDWAHALDHFRGKMEDNNYNEGEDWEAIAGFKGHLSSLTG